MAKNQTFSVSLSLMTQNFNRGIRAVQTSLRGLRAQFQTLLGGVGLGLGFRELFENARNLDKARTTLRNVSSSFESFGNNQEFVMDLARRYNQDLITLTGTYAKFHSAAEYAGFSLDDQKNIFESLTRAAAYFNLTADETNGVMLAIQQMISKGKVSYEELRRQLGERLPGALNLAAKAMGVSTEQLDEMIRKGDVLATELLPLLASELNALTSNLDVNTIQGAVTRLKNAFTELVDKANVGNAFKNFFNWTANGVQRAADNLSEVGSWIMGAILTLGFNRTINAATQSFGSFASKLERDLDRVTTKSQVLKSRLEGISKINLDYDTATGKVSIAGHDKDIKPAALDRANRLAKDYNKTLDDITLAQEMVNNKTSNWAKHLGNKVWKSIKTIGSGLASLAASAALSAIITWTINWFRKLNEVKRTIKEIKGELDTNLASASPDLVKAEALQFKDGEALTETQRANRIKEINKLLGRTGDLEFNSKNTNEEINAALQERINNLKKVNELESEQEALSKLQTTWNTKTKDYTNSDGTAKSDDEKIKAIKDKIASDEQKIRDIYAQPTYGEFDFRPQQTREYEIEIKQLKQLVDLYNEIQKSKKKVAELSSAEELQKTGSEGKKGPSAEDLELQKEYEKIQKEFNTKLKALNDQYADNAMVQKDYDEAIRNLYFSTLESIYALEGVNEKTDEFAKVILDNVQEYIKMDMLNDKTNKALAQYHDEVYAVEQQYANGLITQKELEDEIYNLTQKVLETISGFGDLNEAAEGLAEWYRVETDRRANEKAADIKNPELGSRDATFDYKKASSDIAGENMDIWKNHKKEIEDVIEKLEELQKLHPTDEIQARLEELNAELEKATANADSFEQAMNLATIQEDVQSLSKEMRQGWWDGFKNIASAADRLTSAVKNVKETMEDPDAEGWEKILVHLNAIVQTVDSVLSIVQVFTQLKEVMDKLAVAEQTYQAVEEAGAAKTLMNAGSTVIAKEAEATAAGTAEAAKMPFPANVLAIAGIVGMIAAIFASLPKFAHGGIMKGSSTIGDNNLARINAGEMILNPQQQASLFGLLNGSNSGMLGKNGGNVSFEIKGDKLVGVLNNYSKKISK